MPTLHVIPKPEIIDNEDKARKLLVKILKQPWVAIDTETDSLDVRVANMVCWTLAWPGYRGYVQGSLVWIKKVFKDWLANAKYKKAFHNAKFDMAIFENHGMPVHGLLYDTYVIDWLVDENRKNNHGLKGCAKDHLGLQMESLKDVMDRNNTDNFRGINREDQIEYSTKDAYATSELLTSPSLLQDGTSLPQTLRNHNASIPGRPKRHLLDHLVEVEMPFVEVLKDMENLGITVDRGYLEFDLKPQMEDDMEQLEQDVNKKAGMVINMRSPRSLQELFFERMGLKPTKFTAGGKSGKRQPSTDSDVIEQFAKDDQDENGIFKLIDRYKKTQKAHSTYVLGLLKALDENDRVHTSFKSADLLTGRLSSTKPNLMNIPNSKRDTFGIRKAFTAEPSAEPGELGKLLIVADYEQLEMRIMAHFCEDKNLIDTIVRGIDVHSQTAANMFDLDYDAISAAKAKKKDDLTDEDLDLLRARDDAKIIGFGLIYGRGAYALADQLGCTTYEAQEKLDRYFDTYPGVQDFIANTHLFCLRNLYVQTILGRYRRIPEIRAGMVLDRDAWVLGSSEGKYRGIRKHAQNQAVNTPIQGSAADIAKMAMIKTSRAFGDSELVKLGCDLLLQVHDELIWECPEQNVEKARPIIKKHLEHPFDFELRVPIPVEIGVGYIWSEAK